jgi:hypothetical protein
MKYPDRQQKTIGIGVIRTKSWFRHSHRREPTPPSPPPFTIVRWHSNDGSAASTPSIQPRYARHRQRQATRAGREGRESYVTKALPAKGQTK